MNLNPVVLIVSSAFGDGHAKVAEALEQSFTSRGMEQVHIVDLFAEVHPLLNELSRKFYLTSAVYAPGLYGSLYQVTSRMKPRQSLSRFLHSIGKRKARKLLDEMQPDVIIHTFPYLAAAQLSQEAGGRVQTFTVLTDYVLHGRWIHPYTMRYFTATDHMKQALLSEGVAEERIVLSGIPIRAAFTEAGAADRDQLLQKHGLHKGRRYLLLAAGAYGVMSNIQLMIRTVLGHSDLDLIVLCGNNEGLRASLEDLFHDDDRIRILGYTDQMHELMSISFCLLTKAGGITLTEAFALALPVIVYRPLSGQEEGNARVLSQAGVLYTAYNRKELIERLRQLEAPAALDELKQRMAAMSRTAAADHVVAEVLSALEQQPYIQQAPSAAVEGKVTTVHGYR